MAHSLADWRRRGKQGILVNIPSDCEKVEDRIVATALTAVDSASVYYQELDHVFHRRRGDRQNAHEDGRLRGILDAIYCTELESLTDDRAKGRKLFEILRGYYYALENDAVMYYISRKNTDGTTTSVRTMVEDALKEKYHGRRTVTQNPRVHQNDIRVEAENEIAIVHQGYQAGVNM